MTKSNLEKCKSGNKGITLIALVITIIVLLILAGITIAALTGSDSAPAKANEAKQKNDIGAAKDDVAITVQNALTDAYTSAYVDGGSTKGSASTDVGTAVKNAVNRKYGTTVQRGLANIKSETKSDGNGEVTIWTTDFKVLGTIDKNGGVLSWGEIGANDGTTPGSGGQTGNDEVGGPTIVGDLKPQIWDSINYNPGTISTASIELPEGTEIEKTKLASLNLPQGTALEGDVAASQATDWKILNVTDDGEVLIIPTNGTLAHLSFEGHTGYNNLITALDEVASIYKNPIYAKDARSITYEDVKRVETSSNPYYYYYNDDNHSKIDKDDIECVTDSWNHRYSVDENINIIDHGKKMIATETISGDEKIMIDIPSEEDNVVCSTFYGDNINWCLGLKQHDPLDELSYDYNTFTKKDCLLASRKAVLNNKDCTVQGMLLNDGYCRGIELWEFREDNEVITSNNSLGGSVVPVVSLKKGVTMEKDNNGVWQLTPTEGN